MFVFHLSKKPFNHLKHIDYEETKENDEKNIVWRDWEQLEKAGKWHKNLIKDWVICHYSVYCSS